MKAMIATAVLVMSCQGWANSFEDFAKTPTGSSDIHSIIIKTKQDVNLRAINFGPLVMSQNPLIAKMGIHLLQINPTVNVNKALSELRKHPAIAYAQLDHKVSLRAATQKPNDPEFRRQWSMELSNQNFGIDALQSWLNFGVGGIDINNNEIVVAVIDGGVEGHHPDLIDNRWVNQNEIPGNRIDDDNNGYVDDVYGWNGYNNSANLQTDDHGTHVAGIVGARGNNDTGVTGVNWDVKIMNVPGASGTTSVVLRSYNYILEQKRLWIETKGERGANVVVTNSSFGIDFADCNSGDYPAWNDIYNEMGSLGILSAAATMNRPENVDVRGDVPTGCDSPYIVAVTNSRRDGERDHSDSPWGGGAAYGQRSIDLAAPGDQILSLVTNGGVTTMSGTSMATPHVAGAIAYLHSTASQPLADLFQEDPAAAALELKDILINTVTQRPKLQSETVSGGILNLYNAADVTTQWGMGL